MLHRHTLGPEWIAADEGATRAQRPASSPRPLASARAALDPIAVARLQRTVGNQAVLELLRLGTPPAG